MILSVNLNQQNLNKKKIAVLFSLHPIYRSEMKLTHPCPPIVHNTNWVYINSLLGFWNAAFLQLNGVVVANQKNIQQRDDNKAFQIIVYFRYKNKCCVITTENKTILFFIFSVCIFYGSFKIILTLNEHQKALSIFISNGKII